jgi:uncharacterized protein
MINLPDRWKEKLKVLFETYAPEFEVWAYGSRVTGQGHDSSDLDLVLVSGNNNLNQRCKYLGEIKQALSEGDIPIMVDVLDWASLPPEFHQEINKNKVKLFDPIK